MNADEMKRRLRAVDVNQSRMCQALGIGRSAPTHWNERVPEYVRTFIIALELLDPPGRLDLIHKACVERMREEDSQS